MVKSERLWVICAACLLMVACSGQGPQRPSRVLGRTPEPDSAQLALLEMNQRLALEADRQLQALAAGQAGDYALYDGGIWVKIVSQGDIHSPKPEMGTNCTVRTAIYSLKGQLYLDAEQEYLLGQSTLPFSLEQVITQLYPQTQARLMIPWYAAYGVSGTETIPPYENIIIDLYIE